MDRPTGRENFSWMKQAEPTPCAAESCPTVACIIHDGIFYCGKHALEAREQSSVCSKSAGGIEANFGA